MQVSLSTNKRIIFQEILIKRENVRTWKSFTRLTKFWYFDNPLHAELFGVMLFSPYKKLHYLECSLHLFLGQRQPVSVAMQHLLNEHSRVSRATVLVEPPLPILHGKLKEFHVTWWHPMIHGQKFWTILPVQALKWLSTAPMLFTIFFSLRPRGEGNFWMFQLPKL